MEWEAITLCEQGKPLPRQRRYGRKVRGRLVVTDTRDPIRKRLVRVARLVAQDGAELLTLYDVQLVGTFAEGWTLAGLETVTAGAFEEPAMLAQSWLIMPAPVVDLERSEIELQKAHRELAALRAARPPGRAGGRPDEGTPRGD